MADRSIAIYLNVVQLTDDRLHELHASDQGIYPTALALQEVKNWAAAAPELSLALVGTSEEMPTDAVDAVDAAPEGLADGLAAASQTGARDPLRDGRVRNWTPRQGRWLTWDEEAGRDASRPPAMPAVVFKAGDILVVPVKRDCWEDLVAGRLLEEELRAPPAGGERALDSGAFHCAADPAEGEVALHVFHIEKTPYFARFGLGCFAVPALETVRRRALQRGWTVVGWSGLCNEQGERTFARMGFKASEVTATAQGRVLRIMVRRSAQPFQLDMT